MFIHVHCMLFSLHLLMMNIFPFQAAEVLRDAKRNGQSGIFVMWMMEKDKSLALSVV